MKDADHIRKLLNILEADVISLSQFKQQKNNAGSDDKKYQTALDKQLDAKDAPKQVKTKTGEKVFTLGFDCDDLGLVAAGPFSSGWGYVSFESQKDALTFKNIILSMLHLDNFSAAKIGTGEPYERFSERFSWSTDSHTPKIVPKGAFSARLRKSDVYDFEDNERMLDSGIAKCQDILWDYGSK